MIPLTAIPIPDDCVIVRRADLEAWMQAVLAEARRNGNGHEPLLTLAQAADRLGVSKNTVCRMVQRGEIPAVRSGRVVRIRATDLDNLVEGNNV